MQTIHLLRMFAVVAICATRLAGDDVLDESKLIAKMALFGAHVERDGDSPGHPVIGNDFQRSKTFKDEHVHLLGGFPELTRLNLARSRQITDKGLANIGRFKSLTMIDLTLTQITDWGLKELNDIPNLTELSLYGTKVTDTGVDDIHQQKNLILLDIRGTKITEDGIALIRESMPKLRNIDEIISSKKMNCWVISLTEMKCYRLVQSTQSTSDFARGSMITKYLC